MSICALCELPSTLRESHILPAFVFDWMRKTSATGHIRLGTTPNRRVQDGFKKQLLCDNCEGKLSKWEKSFAERMFVPHHDWNSESFQPSFQYESWLAKFAVSVSWRSLLLMLREQGFPPGFPESLQPHVHKAETTWRQFLLDQVPNPGAFEQHAIFFQSIAQSSIDVPTNMNRYLTRSPEIDLVFSPDSVFVYSKLCRIVILGFIEMPTRKKWRGTKIRMNYGQLPEVSPFIDQKLIDYMMGRARKLETIQASLSSRQKQKIEESLMADPDRTANSDTFRALLDDLALSGEFPFPSDDP